MKVVATRPGFYAGALHATGDEFEVADGAKAAWFTALDATPKAPKAPKSRAKNAPESLGQVQKDDGKSMSDVLA